MDLKSIVNSYIENPFPLWETEATEALILHKWDERKKNHLHNQREYSTSRCINKFTIPIENRFPISNDFEPDVIYLETASFKYLHDFYNEHGLYPCNDSELKSNDSLTKLKNAINIFELVKPADLCIKKLVRSMQVLKQENPEIDVSYSHPDIPFSIFVSLCQDNTDLSSLRVAESILHEAMHLKLTLIENVIQLVKPNTGNFYYSPWRVEKRPAQGILHGLFVFRTIFDFFSELKNVSDSKIIIEHINFRNEQITNEILQLTEFFSCSDLTTNGAILTKNLLPSN